MAKNMNALMKQAQQMQQKMATLQKELESRELETSSGGGMIKIKINGKQEIISMSINPEGEVSLRDRLLVKGQVPGLPGFFFR